MQQRTEKILASAKNELSVCASSGVSMLFLYRLTVLYPIDKGTAVTPSVAAPQKGHRFVEKDGSAALNPVACTECTRG